MLSKSSFNITISNMQYINPLTRYSKGNNEEDKKLIMKANCELENMQMRRFISHKKQRSCNMYNTSLSFKSTSSLCTWGGGIKRSWKQLISKPALNTRINAQPYKRINRYIFLHFLIFYLWIRLKRYINLSSITKQIKYCLDKMKQKKWNGCIDAVIYEVAL